MRARIDIDPDWLRSMYIEHDMSTYDISLLVPCSHETVRKRLIEYGIPIRSNSKLVFDRGFMSSAYADRGKSCNEIASMVGCSPNTVRRRMRELCIPVRTNSEAHSGEKHRCYGKHLSEDTRHKISIANSGRVRTAEMRSHLSELLRGENHPMYGRVFSTNHRKHLSDALRGPRNPMYGRTGDKCPAWNGGKSFEPYCHKFNLSIKERVRDEFGRKCFLCEERENGRKLDIHHVDYNKGQGCGHAWNIIPLCRSCHAKTNANRWHWFCLLNCYWALPWCPCFGGVFL